MDTFQHGFTHSMRMRLHLFVCILAVLVSAAHASGQVIWFVDDDNCPGPGDGSIGNPFCSIQVAIDTASNGDSVEVAHGLYLEAINLGGKAVHLFSADGPETTVIDATGLGSSVVTCDTDEGPDTIIEGFTITGGTGTLIDTIELGGGMYNEGSSPTVTNCTFAGNAAAFGGGMVNFSSSNPTLSECMFSGNTAFSGGGVFNTDSIPIVTNCTFLENSASSDGGGMLNTNGGNPTITNCTFSGNTATNGGGMSNSGSSPTLLTCTFSANMSDSKGGGIYNTSLSNPTVTNCMFSGNTAYRGGGIDNFNGNPTVTNCTFSGNTATNGGGMYNSSSSSAEIGDTFFCGNDPNDIAGTGAWTDLGGNDYSCVFHVPADFSTIQGAINALPDGAEIVVAPGTYNEAINFGGKAIHLRASDGPEVTIIDATGLNNSVVTCQNGEGPDTIIEGFTITGGNANNGGGMRNSSSSPTVTNCIFSGNSANFVGGGMHNFNSSPTLFDCLFLDNVAPNAGGMYNASSSSPTVTDCVFSDNTASGAGGGMYNFGSSPVVTGCTLSGNAANDGGGMYNNVNSNPEIGDTLFCQNAPENIAGAGAWIDLGGNNISCAFQVPADFATIQGAIDTVPDGAELVVEPGMYNEAIDFGGKAIHVRSSNGPDVTIIDASGLNTSVVTCDNGEGSDTVIEGFTITGGAGTSVFTSTRGGGMYNSGASPTVTNCTFTSNAAGIGGGMFNSSGTPTVSNCTFSGNTAITNGGGIVNNLASPTLNNCTFTSNSALRGGALYNFSISNPTITNCAFNANTASKSGGAMYTTSSSASPAIGDSLFCENDPDDIAGAGTWIDLGGNEFDDSCDSCSGDINGSGEVNVFDLLAMLAAWGNCPGCLEDLDADDVVNVFDLLALLSAWGICP